MHITLDYSLTFLKISEGGTLHSRSIIAISFENPIKFPTPSFTVTLTKLESLIFLPVAGSDRCWCATNRWSFAQNKAYLNNHNLCNGWKGQASSAPKFVVCRLVQDKVRGFDLEYTDEQSRNFKQYNQLWLFKFEPYFLQTQMQKSIF